MNIPRAERRRSHGSRVSLDGLFVCYPGKLSLADRNFSSVGREQSVRMEYLVAKHKLHYLTQRGLVLFPDKISPAGAAQRKERA